MSVLTIGKGLRNQGPTSPNKVLIISSKQVNEERLVNGILDARLKMDNNLRFDFYDITNRFGFFNLFDKNLTATYSEFWLITDQFPEYYVPNYPNIMSAVFENLNVSGLPGLILTSKLSLFNDLELDDLGIASCQSQNLTAASTANFSYANSTQFSSYFQGVRTSINPWNNGTLVINNCSLSSVAVNLVEIEVMNSQNGTSSFPALFRPNDESNVIVSPFMLDNSSASLTGVNVPVSSNNEPQFGHTRNLISQTVGLDLFSFLSLSSLLNLNDFHPLSLSNLGIIPGSSSVPITSSVSAPATNGNPSGSESSISSPSLILNQDDLMSTLLTGSLLLGLISLIVILLKRYGFIIIGFVIGLLALFKVPSRKISVMEVYDNPTRRKILDILARKKGQGETVRKISKQLAIPLPTLLWHFDILEDFELIVKEKVKRETVLISMEYIEDFDRYGKALKEFELTFKTEKAKNIYKFLLRLDSSASFSLDKLVKETNYSRRTVKRYINKLLGLGLITFSTIHHSKQKKYRLSSKFIKHLKQLN